MPIDVKVVWHNRPFEAIIQEVVSEKHDLLLKMAHQHDKLEAVIFLPRRTGICCVNALARCGWSKTSRGRKAAKRWSPSISPAKRIITTPLTRSWFAETLSLAEEVNHTEVHLIGAYSGDADQYRDRTAGF